MTAAIGPGGPSLETYVETRFNLLIESFNYKVVALNETLGNKIEAQDHTLVAFVTSSRMAGEALSAAYEQARAATDLRYQQRFEAQSDALAAAFQSQQTAMGTAFVVAEKAVQAALAAADRAVSKAELAADKRFEALNELRQMLNDIVGTLITRVEFHTLKELVTSLEARFSALQGVQLGHKETKDDSRANLALVMSFVGTLLAIVMAFLKR